MNKSFDEWWEENYMMLSADRTEAFDIYYLGQQSKQTEIDELQKRVKELELINFDSELHFDAAKEHIDLLQKRIDDALHALYERDKTKEHRIDKVYEILKGIVQ